MIRYKDYNNAEARLKAVLKEEANRRFAIIFDRWFDQVKTNPNWASLPMGELLETLFKND